MPDLPFKTAVYFYGAGAKRKQLVVPLNSLLNQMVEKIEAGQGRQIYPQRLTIAESVFVNILFNKRLNRFALIEKVKVNIQWLLYCLLYPYGKDYKIQDGIRISLKVGRFRKAINFK